jgi:flagellin-specific chaperone FliS
MTQSQKESLYMIYVHVCNGLMYAQDLMKDETLDLRHRRGMMTLVIKFEWMKKALEIKTDGSVLRQIDTLRYDELSRVVSHLNNEQQDEIEKLVIAYVKENFLNDESQVDSVQELSQEVHADDTQKQS